MSGRARGVPPQGCINHDFPHQVAIRVIVGQNVGVVHRSGPLSSLCLWRRQVNDGQHTFEIFCFADPAQAAAFRETLGGEVFDPRDQAGHRWARGRGARRDARRR